VHAASISKHVSGSEGPAGSAIALVSYIVDAAATPNELRRKSSISFNAWNESIKFWHVLDKNCLDFINGPSSEDVIFIIGNFPVNMSPEIVSIFLGYNHLSAKDSSNSQKY